MARADLAVVDLARAGSVVALTAPTLDGDAMPCGPGVVLVVANASGGSITVTLPTPATFGGQPVDDVIVTVPAAATRYIPVNSVALFGQAFGSSDQGKAYVNYSAVAGITRGVFRAR